MVNIFRLPLLPQVLSETKVTLKSVVTTPSPPGDSFFFLDGVKLPVNVVCMNNGLALCFCVYCTGSW